MRNNKKKKSRSCWIVCCQTDKYDEVKVDDLLSSLYLKRNNHVTQTGDLMYRDCAQQGEICKHF